MRELLLFLPDEVMPLVLMLCGLGVIVGVVKSRMILGLLLLLLMSPLIAAVFDTLLDSLPGWLAALLVLAIALSLLRTVFNLVIGPRATAHMTGTLAADLVRGCFRLVFLPFRILGWLVFR